MKTIVYFIFLFSFTFSNAQIQDNNFEINNGLDIFFGSTDPDYLWQIGVPQKTFFDQANSAPNALLTDTLITYPPNQVASFIIELDFAAINTFPFIQVEWMQKTDMEDGVDGGIIEASYDGGQTWLNVLDDPTYRPAVVGMYQADTLFNGQAGLTGTEDWSWVAICWGTFYGTQPTNVNEIRIRYTFISNAIDTQQEGWMIDDFIVQGDIIGSTSNQNVQPISVFPNPTQQDIYVDLSSIQSREGLCEIFDFSGRKIFSKNVEFEGNANYKIPFQGYPEGLYYFTLRTEGKFFRSNFLKIN